MKYRFINGAGWEKWVEADRTMRHVKLVRPMKLMRGFSLGEQKTRHETVEYDVYEQQTWREGDDEEIVYVNLENPDLDDMEERFARAQGSRKLDDLVGQLREILEPYARAERQGKHASAMFEACRVAEKLTTIVDGLKR